MKTAKTRATTPENSNGHDDDEIMGLRKSIKMLHFGTWVEKDEASIEIRSMARQSLERLKMMAELGVILPLVDMVASDIPDRRSLAVLALIELATGSFTNKVLMVRSGLFSKLPQRVEHIAEHERKGIMDLVLSISALVTAQVQLQPSQILVVIIGILESESNQDIINSCLATLHNFSSILDNIGTLASPAALDILITLSMKKPSSEKALATLSNLVMTATGRKPIESHRASPEVFIEVLTWEDKPKCQEMAAYILMVLAHQSVSQRKKMMEAGIIQALVEVALLSSTLAQKRALKLLRWLKEGADFELRRSLSEGVESEQGKRFMKRIVKQSLNLNLERITRRANGGRNCKGLVGSSSSKSLPY